jgi:uncharacterized membrane protein
MDRLLRSVAHHLDRFNVYTLLACVVLTTLGLFMLAHGCHIVEGVDPTVCSSSVTVLVESRYAAWGCMALFAAALVLMYFLSHWCHTTKAYSASSRSAAVLSIATTVFSVSMTAYAVAGVAAIQRIPASVSEDVAVCYVCPSSRRPGYLLLVYAPVAVCWCAAALTIAASVTHTVMPEALYTPTDDSGTDSSSGSDSDDASVDLEQ